MKLLRSVLIILGIVMAGPATAATHCTCTGGFATPSGAICTQWKCDELMLSAPTVPVRSAKSCPRSRALVCEWGSCTLVCDASKK